MLQRLGLPTSLPAGLAPQGLLARMHLDKKADARGLRFVLWTGAGKACITSGVDPDTVVRVLAHG